MKSKKKSVSADYVLLLGSAVGLILFIPMWWFIPETSTKLLLLLREISQYGLGLSGSTFIYGVVRLIFFKKSKNLKKVKL